MFAAIKGLFASRKFWLTVIGSAIVGGMQLAGVEPSIITAVAGLFGVSIAARGISEIGQQPPTK